jgi:vacuolar-type H+-ATPase subunit C/Vma6
VLGDGTSGGGGEKEPFTGRAATGYDHGYDGEIFYLALALDPAYVEGCLEGIREDNPEEEQLFRDLLEDEIQREVVIDSLKADSVRSGGGGLEGL